MQPDGVGALHIAFEQLKTKLACEGLFDEKNKIALPKYPEKIGVVTSPTGAAVQDIFNILSRRWPLANIVLFPVKVQGDKAPSEICKGITSLDNETDCDVIIIGRGGGSIEDLWAFNNENVARTIAACKTPIVSAVGHETDFTIADFVADMRAPTPSAAAELVSPDINEISSHIDKCRNEMNYKVQYLLNDDKQRLDNIYMNPIFKQPESMLWVYQKKFENSENALVKATNRIISEEQKQLSKKCAELEALSPLKVLSRGYSVAKQNKKILKSVKDINYDKNIEVFLHDGSLECEVQNIKEGSFNFNEK
jgi:exodeoxyribonuclease VII large subunit